MLLSESSIDVLAGQKGRISRNTALLFMRGVPVSFLSPVQGRCRPDDQDWKESPLIYPKVPTTETEWPVSNDVFARWHLLLCEINSSGSRPSGEKVQIDSSGFYGGHLEQTRARADCFQLFVKFGLKSKDSKGPSPLFCLNGILLYQLFLEAWPDSLQCFAKLLFLSKQWTRRKRSSWPLGEFSSLLGSAARALCSPSTAAQHLLLIIL